MMCSPTSTRGNPSEASRPNLSRPWARRRRQTPRAAQERKRHNERVQADTKRNWPAPRSEERVGIKNETKRIDAVEKEKTVTEVACSFE